MDEIVRYRIRNKFYLCLTPEEAITTGVTTGEQVVERVVLKRNPGWGCKEFAVIRTEPLQQLSQIPALERQEQIFADRRQAQEFINSKPKGLFLLCGITETQTVNREEIHTDENQAVDALLKELKFFDRK